MNTRKLNEVLKALGGDPTSEMPDLSNLVVPVYILDDATGALPNRGSMKCAFTAVPTAVAAVNCTLEVTPKAGMWIRRVNVQAQNSNIGIQTFQPTVITTFQIPPVLVIANPEGALPFVPLLGFRADSYADINGLTGALNSPPPQPDLFQAFRMGVTAASVSQALFAVGGTSQDYMRDMWCPPGATFIMQTVAPNVQPTWYVELEFPALTPGLYP